MNWKGRFLVGVLTALAMLLLTYALPRGNPLRDAALVQFPLTVGVWAIFVLLFVKLKEPAASLFVGCPISRASFARKWGFSTERRRSVGIFAYSK